MRVAFRSRLLIFVLTLCLVVGPAGPADAGGRTDEPVDPDPLPAATSELVEPGESVPGEVVPGGPLPDPLPRLVPPAAPVFPVPGAVELVVGDGPPAGDASSVPPHVDGYGPADRRFPLALWQPRTPGPDDAETVPAAVHAEVLDVEELPGLGVIGLAFTLTRADGVAEPGTVTADAAYREFAHAAGGDLAGRLEVVAFPVCVLLTPADPACRTHTAVETDNLHAAGLLRGELPVAGDPAAGPAPDAGAEGFVFALVSDPGGTVGDYAASPIAATGEWAVGIGSGDFTWSEPTVSLPLPQGGQGVAPSLRYSSASVDGRTTAENPQASWVGLGWDVTAGSITQVFTECATPSTESCYYEESGRYSIALNGVSSDLVPVAGESNMYRLRTDPGWQVFHDTQRVPSAWIVTSPDGVRSYFGWSAESTQSVWDRPVLNAAGVLEDAPWNWALSHVRDTSDNMTAYYYTRETNYYQSIDGKRLYDRGGFLSRIDFGRVFDGDPEESNLETGRVDFATQVRCADLVAECAEPGFNAPALEYPDVPTDLVCTAAEATCAEESVSFFTTNRLASLTSSIRSGATFVPLDQVLFTHAFVDAVVGDDADPQLWLDRVQKVGLDGDTADVALPATIFTPVALPNRADAIEVSMPRIASITLPAGGSVAVGYGRPNPCPDPLPEEQGAGADYDCYPAWGSRDVGTDGFVWYHKHLVTSITRHAGVGGLNPPVAETTTYSYEGVPQIHHDDNLEVPADQRGWGIWRGYAAVVTSKGAAGVEVDRYLVLRGMHGDKVDEDTTLSVPVEDSHGNQFFDHDWFTGRIYEHQRYDTATLLELTTTTPGWGRLDANNNSVDDLTTARMPVVVSSMVTQVVPGGTNRVMRNDTFYNGAAGGLGISYGLPDRVIELGDTATGGDDRCTTTTYAINPTAWVLRPASVAVRSGASCTNAAAARTDTLYDGSNVLGAAPGRGLPTQVRTYSSASAYSVKQSRYDVQGRAISSTDPNGNVTGTSYSPSLPADGLPQEVTVTNPLGHVTHAVLHPRRQTPTVTTDPNGHQTTLAYDGLGRLVRVWKPTENPTPPRNPASIEYEYSITQAAPPRISTYTLQGLDPSGLPELIASHTFYDGLSRPREVQTVAPKGDGRIVTAIRYDDRGREAARSMPLHMSGAAGSGMGNPLPGSIDSETRTSYDGLGRPISTSIYRDGAAQPELQTDTTYQGTSITVTPAGGMATTTYTDAFGRAAELVEHYTPAGATEETPWHTVYTHDVLDNLTTITDPLGNITTYGYDQLSRRTSSDDPDTGAWSYTYDPAGNQIKTTDAAGVANWAVYDELNRQTELRRKSATGKLLSSWTYDTGDRKGLLVSAKSQVDGSNYRIADITYDPRNRIISKTYDIPGAAGALAGDYTFNYGYDSADHRTSITYPAAGGLAAETVTTDFSERGYEVSTAGDEVYLAQIRYRNYGLVSRLDYGGTGNLNRRYTYHDATRWLSNLRTDLADAIIQDTQIKHDLAGNRIELITADSSTPNECFSYDAANRLSQAATADGTDCSDLAWLGTGRYFRGYSYDAANNIQTVRRQPLDLDAHEYLYPASGPESTGPHALWQIRRPDRDESRFILVAEYDHDANGQRTQSDTALDTDTPVHGTYNWDAQHRLVQTTLTTASSTDTSSYVYDADGNRLLRTENQTTTLYLDNTELTAEAGAVSATRYYTTAQGDPVGLRTSDGARSRIVLDQQGSTQYVVANVTNAVHEVTYLPYGQTRNDPAGLPTDRRYLHEPNDQAGLIHLGARYYDPAIAQFLSPDPLLSPTNPRSLNGYAYAFNNPTTYTDPTGQYPDPGCGGMSGIPCPTDPPPTDGGSGPDPCGGLCDSTPEAPPPIAVDESDIIGVVNEVEPWCTGPFGCAWDVGWELTVADGADCITGDGWTSCGWTALGFVGVGKLKSVDNVWDAWRASRKSIALLCRASSFAGDTPVLMADGSKKPIRKVRKGDLVKTADPGTEGTMARPVVRLIRSKGIKKLIEFSVDRSPRPFVSTDDHPIWSNSQQKWVNAGALRTGEEVRQADGGSLQVLTVERRNEEKRVYNFTVAVTHTYFIGRGKSSVLVHNAGCPFSLDALSSAAAQPFGGQSITVAARAFNKHAARPNNPFPPATGNVAAKNAHAQQLVDDILTAPGTVIVNRTGARPGYYVIAPNGRGLAYDLDGQLDYVAGFQYPGAG